MKIKLNRQISVLLAATALIAPAHFHCQRQAEKRAKATLIDLGMYEGSQSQTAMEYYWKGVEKQGAEEYKAAVELYEMALKEDPNFIEALDNMGVCYRNQGDFKKAKKCYRRSIALFPEGRVAHQNLGMIYGIEKKYEEALAEYAAIQKTIPDDPEGYYGTAQIYIETGDFEAAIRNATKALQLYEATNSPHKAEGQYLLGVSYYLAGEKEKARTYLELAQKGGIEIPPVLKNELQIK